MAYTEIRPIRGTTAEWATYDIVIGENELGFELVAGESPKMKLGDGIHRWSELPYAVDFELLYRLTNVATDAIAEIADYVIQVRQDATLAAADAEKAGIAATEAVAAAARSEEAAESVKTLLTDKGFYPTQEALELAFPTATPGSFARVEATGTYWDWDEVAQMWVDTETSFAGGADLSGYAKLTDVSSSITNHNVNSAAHIDIRDEIVEIRRDLGNKICSVTATTAAAMLAWVTTPEHRDSLLDGAPLFTLDKDDPDFRWARNITTGEFEVQEIDEPHQIKRKATTAYVDTLVGDINAILDQINGEVL